jgi:hypothetical protein
MFSLANLKRLFFVLVITAVIAVMTGTPGSSTAPPTTGIHGSFLERVSWFGIFAAPRWLLFFTLGVIVWVGISLYRPRARTIRRQFKSVVARPKQLTTYRSTRVTLIVIALVVVLLLPKFVHESFWMYLIVEQIGVWILLALGLNVVVGFAGLLDLGFAAFYAIGAYTTAWLTGALPTPALFHHPIPTLWIIPLGILAAMVFGVLLGTPTLRLRGDYLAIVTLGFALIIDDFVETQSGVTGGGQGSAFIRHPSLNVGVYHFHWSTAPTPYYYLMSHLHRCLHRRLHVARTLTHRSCVGGDTRGRSGGGVRRHQSPQIQGHGLRRRCGQWRLRGSDDRGPGGFHHAGALHVQRLGERAGVGHLRWHGFDLGRRARGNRYPNGHELSRQLPTVGVPDQ